MARWNLLAGTLRYGRAVATGLVLVAELTDASALQPFIADDPLIARQWHLMPSGTEPDINVLGAWELGYTGAGVTIGVVDGGVQWDHPDLAPNYDPASSYDFGQDDADPYPIYDFEAHGTSVAGLAAARGGNGTGVSGIAPKASLAGLRRGGESVGLLESVRLATLHGADGPNITIDIKNHSYGIQVDYLNPSVSKPFEDAIEQSTARGMIHVFSAGNERRAGGDASKRAPIKHPSTIVVSAVRSNGRHAFYSNYGANLFVAAPTNVLSTNYDTIAAQRDSGPVEYHGLGGTSASAPIVSGALALAKEANPALDSRMAKHLLALTSNSSIHADDDSLESDGGWRTNAAGYRFNQNYGFGLLDVEALVLAATEYAGVTPRSEQTTGYQAVDLPLPDAVRNDQTPGVLTQTFSLAEDGLLEELLVALDVEHTDPDSLQATLTSPSGFVSRLMLREDDDYDTRSDLDWTFRTNAFWGEQAAGDWTLTLEDWYALDWGTWRGFSVTALTGNLIAIPEPGAFVLIGVAVVGTLLSERRAADG